MDYTHHRLLPTRPEELAQYEVVWAGGDWRPSPICPKNVDILRTKPGGLRQQARLAMLREMEGMFYLTAPEIAERIGARFDISSMLARLYRQGILERVEIGRHSFAYRVSARKERAA